MGLTEQTLVKVAEWLFQGVEVATYYLGLIVVPSPWTASTAVTTGTYGTPTVASFNAITGQTGKIFKATTGGTTGSSQPTWPTTAGGTVTDGTVVWTECSLLFDAGTFTGAEPSGNNYSRPSETANATNFPNPATGEPVLLDSGTTFSFPTPSGGWGYAAGFLLSDAASGGNIWEWGAMTSLLQVVTGSSPSFAAASLILSLS
jgi:hypothetical protein